jgi:hypothetical protein
MERKRSATACRKKNCSICLEDLVNEISIYIYIYIYSCKHSFHFKCIQPSQEEKRQNMSLLETIKYLITY